MSTYTVFGTPKGADFAPRTLAEEVLQNVRTIITTARYTVPLDRRFGLDMGCLDRPLPVVEATLSSAIVKAIRQYEPRAEVVSVSFSGDGNAGVLRPRVEVSIHES